MSKYGEPWQLWTSCSWLRVMDYLGRPAIVPTKSQADGHPDMYPADRIDRAIQCVNACAGIPDPQTAMDAAREAMRLAIADLELAGWTHGDATTSCRRALALLTPEDR